MASSTLSDKRTFGSERPALAASLADPSLADLLAPQSNERVEWRCLAHSDIHPNWWTTPGLRVSQNTGCPACGKLPYDVVEQTKSLEALGYRVSLQFAKARHWLSGECGRGHAFCEEVRRVRHGKRCSYCRIFEDYGDVLDAATVAGYRVTLVRDAKGTATLTGSCPAGHDYNSAANNFRIGKRCGACAIIERDSAYIDEVQASGYPVSVTSKSLHGQNFAWIVGECLEGHEFDMSGYRFLQGERCSQCTFEARRQGFIQNAVRDGYTQVTIALPAGSQKRRLRGVCPVGHPVDMPLESFNSGSRCPACAVTGFKPTLPGTFYIVSALDVGGHGRVIQFGISNVPDKRLAKHASNGFDREGATRIQLTGADAQRLETALKQELRQIGIRSCHSEGIIFDGSTESVRDSRLSRSDLEALVATLRNALGI